MTSSLTISNYLDALALTPGTPAGGAAAALMGAQGAALLHLVCALTLNKERYRDHWAINQDIMEKAHALYPRFLQMMEEDTQAYNSVSAAIKLPKETQEQKAERDLALQDALKASTLSPLRIMEQAAQALVWVRQVAGKSNQAAASDLYCAAVNLQGCIQSAYSNVLANIQLMKDQAFNQDIRARCASLLQSLSLTEEVCRIIHPGNHLCLSEDP